MAYQAPQVKSVFEDPATSPIQAHIDILRYWHEKAVGRVAPSWTDVSLAEFPPEVLPTTSVTNIIEDPLSSEYRYWGSGLTKAFGRDYTGFSPIDVPPRALGLSSDGGCGRLVAERAPHFEIKEFKNDSGVFGRALVLRLPLSDDGERITNGINVYHFERFSGDAELTEFFDNIFSKLPDDE